MSLEGFKPTVRVSELREAFDRRFAEPAGADAGATQDDFLTITIGADPYAMRLSEVAGLYLTPRITPLPGSVPALLGLVGLRGALVPV